MSPKRGGNNDAERNAAVLLPMKETHVAGHLFGLR